MYEAISEAISSITEEPHVMNIGCVSSTIMSSMFGFLKTIIGKRSPVIGELITVVEWYVVTTMGLLFVPLHRDIDKSDTDKPSSFNELDISSFSPIGFVAPFS